MRTKHLNLVVELALFSIFKPSSKIVLLTVPGWCFLCGFFMLFMFLFCLNYSIVSVPCGRLLGGDMPLVCGVSSCFVTFPYGVSSQVWYLIDTIPDLCHLF